MLTGPPPKFHGTRDILSPVPDTTLDLIWRRGCDAVSIRDLENALDIRAPSFYRRFHSRDQLPP
jgi:hypothetical protein